MSQQARHSAVPVLALWGVMWYYLVNGSINLNLTKECDCMNCPYCGNEMTSGVVQSAREIFFTTKSHSMWFKPSGSHEFSLSTHNWTRPTCVAYHCRDCKKVVIDYSKEAE